MKRAWFRELLRRRFVVILLLLLQIRFIIYAVHSDSIAAEILRDLLRVLSIVIVLHVTAHKDKGANKVAWVFLSLLFPLFGGAFYLLYHFQSSTKRFSEALLEVKEENLTLYDLPGDAFETAAAAFPQCLTQMRYLQEFAGFPIYDGTSVRYFSPGEEFVEPYLEALKKAERYIFLEYFIVAEGTVWNSVLEVLKEKAAQGVDVRLLYDDIGCFLTLPKNYRKQLQEYGIQCRVFNPFRPILTVMQNNRDHRKITSIDGKTAFTGGLNLADEYANLYEKHGYWKDSAILVEGKAAWSLTLMFLEMWELCARRKEHLEDFYPWAQAGCSIQTDKRTS